MSKTLKHYKKNIVNRASEVTNGQDLHRGGTNPPHGSDECTGPHRFKYIHIYIYIVQAYKVKDTPLQLRIHYGY